MQQAFFDFQGSAVFGVLAFLLTGFLLLVAAVLLSWFLIGGRKLWAARLAKAMLAVAILYASAILAFSWFSRQRVLAHGVEKYFCEVDCHLAYSVLSVEKVRALGNSTHSVAALGTFYVIRLRVRFDENTIRPTRGDFPLSPNPRLVSVVDGKGRQFAPQRNAAELLPKDQAGSATLQDPLRPGESYAVTLVFDLPADVQEPRLLLASGDWQTQFLIGHENSFLHRKTLFGL